MKNYSSNSSLRLKNENSNEIKNDLTKACDEIIPIARKIAVTDNGFDEAIDLLFHLEKLTRAGCDMISCSRVLVEIVNLCAKTGNWIKLNEYVSICSKRVTFKEAITKMIQETIKFINIIPDNEIKLNLIKTLRNVTKGKVYVEVERARLTEILADILERDGRTEDAAKLLSELKVESYGSMTKQEKLKLILHQMRLLIAVEQFVKAQLIAQKIIKKILDEPQFERLKLQYYHLKIELDRDEEFLKTAQHYQSMLECSSVVLCQRRSMLANCILYCILAPYNSEQKDMMENIIKMDTIKETPVFKSILELFLSNELINMNEFIQKYLKVLSKYEVFCTSTQHGKKCWKELINRIIEHNILIISNYYNRIYLNRLSELLNVTELECEQHISRLVNLGMISVKIDRILGIVYFKKEKISNEILNDWTNDLNLLMENVNKVTHLINNEICVVDALN